MSVHKSSVDTIGKYSYLGDRFYLLMPMRLPLQIIPLMFATMLVSCAGISPYCNVPRPELLRAVHKIGIAPVRIESFDLTEGEMSDISAYPLHMLRERLSKTFMILPFDSAVDLRGSRSSTGFNGELLVLGKQAGVDAIVWPEFRYVSTRYEPHVQVHLKFVDVSTGSLIAESGDDGVWGTSWVDYPELKERLRTTVDSAVRRLEEYLQNNR
jgi:hypothetical protein